MANRTKVMSLSDLDLEQSNNSVMVEEINDLRVIIPPFKWENQNSDVALCVGDCKYYAHINILAGKSTVFEKMFHGTWKEHADLMNVRLDETTACQEAFKDFLAFFYMEANGDTLSWINFTAMVTLADKYDCEKLLEFCDNYIHKSKLIKVDSALIVHLLTFFYEKNFVAFYENLKRYAAGNFEEVFKDVPYFSPDVLIDLLGSSDISIKSEEQLFGYVEKWIKKMESNQYFMRRPSLTFEEIVEKVLDQVRFYYLPPEVVVKSSLCEQFGFNLIQKLSLAAKMRNGHQAPNEVLCSRRNYTGKPLVTFRYTVENVSKLSEPAWSPATLINNVHWQIGVTPLHKRLIGILEVKYLGFYVNCQLDHCKIARKCFFNAELEMRLVNRKDESKNLTRRAAHLFNKDDSWGFREFAFWEYVLNESNGYISNDNIIVEVGVASDPPMISYPK